MLENTEIAVETVRLLLPKAIARAAADELPQPRILTSNTQGGVLYLFSRIPNNTCILANNTHIIGIFGDNPQSYRRAYLCMLHPRPQRTAPVAAADNKWVYEVELTECGTKNAGVACGWGAASFKPLPRAVHHPRTRGAGDDGYSYAYNTTKRRCRNGPFVRTAKHPARGADAPAARVISVLLDLGALERSVGIRITFSLLSTRKTVLGYIA